MQALDDLELLVANISDVRPHLMTLPSLNSAIMHVLGDEFKEKNLRADADQLKAEAETEAKLKKNAEAKMKREERS